MYDLRDATVNKMSLSARKSSRLTMFQITAFSTSFYSLESLNKYERKASRAKRGEI